MDTALQMRIPLCLRLVSRLRFGILSTDDGMALQYVVARYFERSCKIHSFVQYTSIKRRSLGIFLKYLQ